MGVIQAPKLEPRIMRYELADYEWAAINPMLPNKPRGVPRVNDRRVLNGIFWILRSGAPWRDLPESFGPYTTCYNRFVRWRTAGIWDVIMEALAKAHDGSVQMIDTSIVRVHQHGGCAEMAKAAAPYLHPKQLAVDQRLKTDGWCTIAGASSNGAASVQLHIPALQVCSLAASR
jgi:transposase